MVAEARVVQEWRDMDAAVECLGPALPDSAGMPTALSPSLQSEVARFPIPLSVPNIGDDERQRVLGCLAEGWVSSAGPEIPAFEREFSQALGGGHAAAVQSGSAALYLALRVVGVRRDDVVLCPSLTFIATANAAAMLGARVELVDVTRRDLCLCPADLQRAITRLLAAGCRIGAVVPVHLYGHVADMDQILRIADHYQIPVVEDATEALGSTWRTRAAGLMGRMGCFSFNGNKIITTGGGGMVVSHEEPLVARARHLAQQARTDSVEFDHDEVGFNFRITNLQAALGRAQLARLPRFIQSKLNVAAFYRQALSSIPGIALVEQPPRCESCYWLATALVDEAKFGMSAARLVRALNDRRILARPLFRPLHQLGLFSESGACPNAEFLYHSGLNLPCSTDIRESELQAVAAAIRDIHKEG